MFENGLQELTVVDVLASQCWGSGLRVLSLTNLSGVLELSALSFKTLIYVFVVTVVDFAVINTGHVVSVFFW